MITYDYPILLEPLEQIGEEERHGDPINAQLDTKVINAIIKVTKDIKHINFNRWESNFKAGKRSLSRTTGHLS